MTIQGTTPFEIAERRRQEGIARLEIAVSTQKIIDHIRECDVQIQYFNDLVAKGSADADEHALVREARKDKKTYEAALEALINITQGLVSIEA